MEREGIGGEEGKLQMEEVADVERCRDGMGALAAGHVTALQTSRPPTAAGSPAAPQPPPPSPPEHLRREPHHFKMAKSVMEPFTFASSRSIKMTLNVRM